MTRTEVGSVSTVLEYLFPLLVLYSLVGIGLAGAALCEAKGVLSAIILGALWPFVLVYLIVTN